MEELAVIVERMHSLVDANEHRNNKQDVMKRAEAQMWLSSVGYSRWNTDVTLPLPGTHGYATANSLADVLLRAHQGKVVQPATLKNMVQSRRPASQGSISYPPSLEAFAESEWGLGLQLVRDAAGADSTPQQPAWGRSSGNGSFAYVLPGERPVVACLALNREDGLSFSEEVLGELWKYTKGR